jgi:hypothetical protein
VVGHADSVTEPLVDAQGLLRGLDESAVDYVVFGALAMLFYGFVRTTEDLDIVVAPDEENLNRVADWLMSLGAVLKLNPNRSFGPRERWAIPRGSNATVLTSLGQIDVVQRIEGMPAWPELVAQAEVYEFEGRKIRVMNRTTLIGLKRRRSSAQDLADIEAIEQLEEL